MHEQDSELFNDLPTEVILENLLPNLDLLELCTLRSVSKAWNYRICLYFSRTKKLDLSEFKDTINETGFRSIVQHLSKLQEIILDGCWRTASKSNLLNLLKNCRSLKYFSSKRCKFVDDEVLSSMSQNCRMLETINISCCYQITSSGVIELFRNCESISAFTVAGNYGFTDEAVKFIGANCSSLQELDFGSCFYVTDVGINELVNGQCTQLKYIRTKGCTKISDEATRKLVQKNIIVNNCF